MELWPLSPLLSGLLLAGFGLAVALLLFVMVGLLLDLVPRADDRKDVRDAPGSTRRTTQWLFSLSKRKDPGPGRGPTP